MFRAGHAHAGVWLVFELVGMSYIDRAGLSEGLAGLVRIAFAAAPILMPLGFFLSVTSARPERPNGMIALVPIAVPPWRRVR